MHPYLISFHQLFVTIMTSNNNEMAISTIFSCIFFGTNCLLCILFQWIQRNDKKKIIDNDDKKKKKLSKPFEGTLEW